MDIAGEMVTNSIFPKRSEKIEEEDEDMSDESIKDEDKDMGNQNMNGKSNEGLNSRA